MILVNTDINFHLHFMANFFNQLNNCQLFFKISAVPKESRGSVVGIETGYGLDDRRVGIRVPAE
jgi:hypothetical protein